jgi:hypothetical protein
MAQMCCIYNLRIFQKIASLTLVLVECVGADFGEPIFSIGNGFKPNCSRILLKIKHQKIT